MKIEELYAKMLARLAVKKEEARNSAAFKATKDTREMRAAHISNMLEDLKRSQGVAC